MHLHRVSGLEPYRSYRVDSASGSSSKTTVYADDSTARPIDESILQIRRAGDVVEFWAVQATVYLKLLHHDRTSLTGTVVTSNGTASTVPGSASSLARQIVDSPEAKGTYARLAGGLVEGSARRFSTDPSVYYAEPASVRLTFTTPDGSGTMTHPSVLYVPGGFAGYPYWLLGTPYDGSDSTIENPCVYASADGTTWAAPPGLTNPIAPHPGGSSFNSDTHLILSNDGTTLYAFYRRSGDGNDTLLLKTSTDGVTWSAASTVLQVTSTAERLLSPAVFWDGTQWVMYTVDIIPATYVVKRRTASSLTGTWSSATTCTVPLPTDREPWHLDARLVGGEVWLLVMDQQADGSGSPASLYLGTSSNGTTFTMSSTSLLPRQTPVSTSGLYRSCFLPAIVDGRLGLDLWYSCISSGGSWGVARTTVKAQSETLYDPVRGMLGGSAVVAPYVAADSFNRADGAAGLGTSDSNHAWSAWAGTAGISSRQAYATAAANTKAVINPGIADGYFELNVTALGSQAWLIFRGTDTNNHWRVGVTSGTLQLQKVVSGSATSPLTTNMGAFTTGRVGVRCSGNTITVYRDGVQVGQAVDSAHATATNVGLQTADTTTRFDNLWVRSLVNGL